MVQPVLIDKINRAVRPQSPGHCWDCVDDKPEAIFALSQNFLGRFTVGDIGHELSSEKKTSQALSRVSSAHAQVVATPAISNSRIYAATLHVTEFCSINSSILIDPGNGRPDVNSNFRLSFKGCEHHNCTDEDCEDYKRVVEMSVKR